MNWRSFGKRDLIFSKAEPGAFPLVFHVSKFIKIRRFLRIFVPVSLLNNNHCICSTIIYTELIFR